MTVKALIVLSDAQHRVLGFRIIRLIREIARFFCAGALSSAHLQRRIQ
jgi:hypothetical protein